MIFILTIFQKGLSVMVYSLFTPIWTHQTNTKRFNFKFQLENVSIIIVISIDISTSNEEKRSNVCDQQKKKEKWNNQTSSSSSLINNVVLFFLYAAVVLRKHSFNGTKSVSKPFFPRQHRRSDTCQTNFILEKNNP